MILKTDGSLQNNNGSNVSPMSRKVVVPKPAPATFFTALAILAEAVIDPAGESHDPPAVILCGPILDDGSGKNAAGFSAKVTTPDAMAAGYQPKQAPAAPLANDAGGPAPTVSAPQEIVAPDVARSQMDAINALTAKYQADQVAAAQKREDAWLAANPGQPLPEWIR